jgi:hypothetical protein
LDFKTDGQEMFCIHYEIAALGDSLFLSGLERDALHQVSHKCFPKIKGVMEMAHH